MEDFPVKLCAAKNLGLVFPPFDPWPSHHRAPLAFKECPGAPLMATFSPEMENKGPDHSSYPQVVSPSKITCRRKVRIGHLGQGGACGLHECLS